MAQRWVDIVYVGPDARQYAQMQRLAGKATGSLASVTWVREGPILLKSEPAKAATVHVFGDELDSLVMGSLLQWLDKTGKSTAATARVPDGSREHLSRA